MNDKPENLNAAAEAGNKPRQPLSLVRVGDMTLETASRAGGPENPSRCAVNRDRYVDRLGPASDQPAADPIWPVEGVTNPRTVCPRDLRACVFAYFGDQPRYRCGTASCGSLSHSIEVETEARVRAQVDQPAEVEAVPTPLEVDSIAGELAARGDVLATAGAGTRPAARLCFRAAKVLRQLDRERVDLAVRLAEADRSIETLRRALVWHGDPARMATTREDWQGEIDDAVAWVDANPEPDRPSRSGFSTPLDLVNRLADAEARLARVDAAAEVLIVARADLMREVDATVAHIRSLVVDAPEEFTPILEASRGDDVADLLDRLAAYMKGQDDRLVAMGDKADAATLRAEEWANECGKARLAASRAEDKLARIAALVEGVEA